MATTAKYRPVAGDATSGREREEKKGTVGKKDAISVRGAGEGDDVFVSYGKESTLEGLGRGIRGIGVKKGKRYGTHYLSG